MEADVSIEIKIAAQAELTHRWAKEELKVFPNSSAETLLAYRPKIQRLIRNKRISFKKQTAMESFLKRNPDYKPHV